MGGYPPHTPQEWHPSSGILSLDMIPDTGRLITYFPWSGHNWQQGRMLMVKTQYNIPLLPDYFHSFAGFDADREHRKGELCILPDF